MRRLDEVDREELKDFLGKGWLTHDGMWFSIPILIRAWRRRTASTRKP